MDLFPGNWRAGAAGNMDGLATSRFNANDDDDTVTPSGHLHSLLRQQDEFIEQLELENKTLKNELTNIKVQCHQITEENRRIIQNWKMDIFHHLLPRKEGKEMSDEEKVFFGRQTQEAKFTKCGCMEHESRIKQLENEAIEMRMTKKLQQSPDDDMDTASRHNSPAKITLQEWNELARDNDRLRETVSEMNSREEEAQNQIKKGIRLVEEAHLEKAKAIADREQLRDDLVQQKKRFEELRTDEESKSASMHKKRLEEAADELAVTAQALERVQMNLERAVHEKRDLEARLEQAERHHELVREDLQSAIARLRSEVSKLRIEQSDAAREMARARVAGDASKRERLQEAIYFESDLKEAQARLKRMEGDYLGAKREAAEMAQKVALLETEIKQISERRHGNRGSSSVAYALSKDMEQSRKNDDLQRVIERQMHLVGSFRSECKRLADEQDRKSEHSMQSINSLKGENAILSQKLAATSERCKRLEAICEERDKRLGEMSDGLQAMNADTARQSRRVLELLYRQTQLQKERQLLHEELHFLHEKLGT